MAPLQPIFKKAFLSLAAAAAVYVGFLLFLMNGWVQRTAVYANTIRTPLWIRDLNVPEQFGFSRRQITPFNISTPDNETIYAWHMLPLGTYALHEDQLINEPAGVRSDFRETLAFKVLQRDPEARIIINFHGNAGHLADGHRLQIYRSLTNLSPKTHIITIDYRGFGYSTGSPHEAGVIADGITVVDYILSLGIPPSRILLLGQSLGTAITSGVALHFADRAASLRLLPQTDNQALNDLFMNSSAVVGHSRTQPTDFAAVILVASFPSLPKLLLTYRMSGLIPVLSPLRIYPKLQQWLLTFIQEDWPTSLRIAALVKSAATSQERRLRLHLIHALDDREIPWQNGEQNYEAAYHALASASGSETIGMEGMDWGEDGFKREAKLGERVKVHFESVRFGGHNKVVASSPVALAVLRAFGLDGGQDTHFSLRGHTHQKI